MEIFALVAWLLALIGFGVYALRRDRRNTRLFALASVLLSILIVIMQTTKSR